MKKYLIIPIFNIAFISSAIAQEYKINQSAGKMVLNLTAVTVEGYNGNKIVFSTTKKETEIDPRAQGLRAIGGGGYTDNTGLGISVEQRGTTTEVDQIGSSDLAIKILVPKNVIVSLTCHKMANSGEIIFKNMENEIEISTDYNKIKLENISGPATINALFGSIDAIFSDHIKGPISIASVYSTVDISIPASTKANLKLSTTHGDIFAAPELKIAFEKHEDNNEETDSGNEVVGKLNGGGLEFKLSSEFGKIYLRKN